MKHKMFNRIEPVYKHEDSDFSHDSQNSQLGTVASGTLEFGFSPQPVENITG